MLELRSATYRHRIRRGTWMRPWATISGPGIRGINLNIKSGNIIGLVGPNGAGKTTLMQILSGLLDLEDGHIVLDGKSIQSSNDKVELSNSIGYMPESVSWVGQGTPTLVIKRLCAMRGIPYSRGEKVLNLVGLSQRSEDTMSTLSQGMKQRLSLAASLLGKPRLLILDEPLNGLDPVAQAAFRMLLRQLADQNVAIIVSSHSLVELERIVDEVVLMHQGRVAAKGPLSSIGRELGLSARLDIAGIGKKPDDFGEGVRVEEIESMGGEDWSFRLHLDEGDWTAERRASIQEKLQITRLSPVPAELEEVLSAATGTRIEDAGFGIFSDQEVGEDE
ncbi:MAG: ABC transporter ATP-binding protein [Candidatus Thermoplasmatota archaeon]|nr:ABC transporter ATP-binding protein [Candidatus Thermoplasmatota archaeon]